MPSRAAVEAQTFEACCRIAELTSDPPRRVSKQAFHLFPRVREIDAALRADAALAQRVFECHPEGAFRFMRGAPLTLPKKVKSKVHVPGLSERRALLMAEGYPPAVLDGPLPRGVGRDDLHDALAASWTAARIARGEAKCFPDVPGRDRYGLEVAIRA
jgi:predicted RNase H-like nuclease